ncbi:MAG: ccr4 associated factor [Cyphobasidiales sp. Tagirdzhanova-0007]|nr:MAG: ccr4 associated factor [Cyphobasidiales sp. Tagirdzhanova-0007]
MAVSRFLIAPIAATRSVLALNGAEAPKFLQGLVSSDIQSSTPANPVYAGFFSAQGRVLYDTFILPSSSLSGDHPHFLVDHSRAVNSTIPSLLAYIKRYILRSKVRVKNADDEYRLWAVFRHPLHVSNEAADTAVEQELEQLASSGRGHWWRDKRSAQLGYRLLLPPSSSSSVETSSFQSSLPTYHTLLRVLSNVPEVSSDLVPNQALPLESNMDIMGGIDFRKGCYIGQELTARTYHTGVIRKRVMPIRLFPPLEVPPTRLLPPNWTSISSVSEVPALKNGDIHPISSTSAEEGRPRRPRSAGRLGSILRVTGTRQEGGAEEQVFLGLALLRLEATEGELGLNFDEQSSEDVELSRAKEAGVNAAGGMVKEEGNFGSLETTKGDWRVKAFRNSLAGAI